jgi:hypothetical protein
MTGLVASAAGQSDSKDAKDVKVEQSWTGRLIGKEKEALRMSAPAKMYVSGPKAFTALWKMWRTEEKVPQVDFKKKIVLVTTAGGPNEVMLRPKLDVQGDLAIKAMSTLVGGPGFGYVFGVVDRAGVKSVHGKPLTEDD